MSTQAYNFDDSCLANAAFAKYRAVVAGGTKQYVSYPSVAFAMKVMGITQHTTVASGDDIMIRRQGVSKVEVAGAVSYGDTLGINDVVGRLTNRSFASWKSGDGAVGMALEASTNSGDIIECWLGIRTLLGA